MSGEPPRGDLRLRFVFPLPMRKPNEKAALIESVGATYVSSQEVPFVALAEEIGGAQIVYEATGAPLVVFQTLEHLGPNAVVMLTGIPGDEGGIEIPAGRLMRKIVLENLAVIGTVNANAADFAAAIADLEFFQQAWPAAVRGIITGRHPLGDFCACALDRKAIKDVIVVRDGQ
jgi:threonine dehydrogenase-like Zn-dependent dehydrogenase